MISKNDPLVAIFNGDRKQLSHYIEIAISEYGNIDSCPYCEKW
jgi:hypothetical protein